jgi:hypothetical protein
MSKSDFHKIEVKVKKIALQLRRIFFLTSILTAKKINKKLLC